MTVDEALAPVLIPIGFGVAVAALLYLIAHVARRYPAVPKRVPWRIRPDGRPSTRTAGKAVLWIAPAILTVLLIVLGALAFVSPPPDERRTTIALVFAILAETAVYTAWALDRQIEMARKMTFRVMPARMLRVSLPLLLTVAVTIFFALRGG